MTKKPKKTKSDGALLVRKGNKYKWKGTRRAATLTIAAPGKMTAKGRSDIAVWLMRQARNLVKDGKLYTNGRFTAGFNYL